MRALTQAEVLKSDRHDSYSSDWILCPPVYAVAL